LLHDQTYSTSTKLREFYALLNKGVMVQKGLLMVQKGKKLHRRTRVVEARV